MRWYNKPFPSVRIGDDIGQAMIRNDKKAELVLARVQDLVCFAGPKNDALALFNRHRGFRAANTALALDKNVHLRIRLSALERAKPNLFRQYSSKVPNSVRKSRLLRNVARAFPTLRNSSSPDLTTASSSALSVFSAEVRGQASGTDSSRSEKLTDILFYFLVFREKSILLFNRG